MPLKQTIQLPLGVTDSFLEKKKQVRDILHS